MDLWEPGLPAVTFAIAISLFAAIAMSALCGWAPGDDAVNETQGRNDDVTKGRTTP